MKCPIQIPNSFDRGDDLQLEILSILTFKDLERTKKPLDLDATIQELLDAGYSREQKCDIKELWNPSDLCYSGEIFMQQPSLVIYLLSDCWCVHGQFMIWSECLKNVISPKSNYLFLGDYVEVEVNNLWKQFAFVMQDQVSRKLLFVKR